MRLAALLDMRTDRGFVLSRVEAPVEARLGHAGDYVFGPRAGVEVGYLKRRGRKELVAVIPAVRGQIGEQGEQPMQRIVGLVWIGNVALASFHPGMAVEAAAPAVLDRIPERVRRRRLAHEAVVDCDIAFAEPLHDRTRAVHRRTFLVARQQEGQPSRMIGVTVTKALGGAYHGGNAGFHIGRATPDQPAVFDRGLERTLRPVVERAGRHHIGMAGKAQQRAAIAGHGPEVVHLAEAQVLDGEAGRGQSFADEFLAAAVGRGDRLALNQRSGQFERFVRHQSAPARAAS